MKKLIVLTVALFTIGCGSSQQYTGDVAASIHTVATLCKVAPGPVQIARDSVIADWDGYSEREQKNWLEIDGLLAQAKEYCPKIIAVSDTLKLGLAVSGHFDWQTDAAPAILRLAEIWAQIEASNP